MILRQAGNPGIERPLPHNPEAEKSILAAVTLDSATPNAALAQALEKLRPDDFFIPQHRHIFEQMVKLGENHDPISTVSLMETLEVAGPLEAAGGVAYLSGLAAGLPPDTDVEYLAGIVKKKKKEKSSSPCALFDDGDPRAVVRAMRGRGDRHHSRSPSRYGRRP